MPKFLFPIILLPILSIISLFYLFLKIDPQNQTILVFLVFSLIVFCTVTFTLSLLFLALSLFPKFLLRRFSRRTSAISDDDIKKRYRVFLKFSFFWGLILGFLTLLKLFALLSIFNLAVLLIIFLVFGYWWFFEKQASLGKIW